MSGEDAYIYSLLEPDTEEQRVPNVNRIVSSFKSIKYSIMIEELIRLHTEALANLYEQKGLRRVLGDMDKTYTELYRKTKARLDALAERYAAVQTEFSKIISE